jgi:GH15 family glucan-1,4-alpha-glucosidase
MARPIVLSNGSLHVGINHNGLVHDFYYPHVGQENHSAGPGTAHRVGVWVDGVTSWLDSDDWEHSFRTADYSLIGHIASKNMKIGLMLEFDNFVSPTDDAFIRSIHVVNLQQKPREVRIFMHQAFIIGDSRSNHDTAQYLPDSDALMHYHGQRVFVISGRQSDGSFFDQHSIGLFGIEGHEGTFRDADDGELANGPVEHGRVDSIIRLTCNVQALDSARVDYWIACGTSVRGALSIHKMIQDNGIGPVLHDTIQWWHEWLKPAVKLADALPAQRRRQFIKSAMLVKSHIDNGGAVIASTDTTMLNYSRDAYAYCWPRDGSYAVWPLIRMGYKDEPLAFFDFCLDALHPNGYLMHKYQADGSLGSSWHPYQHGDIVAPPIQEDETALTLFVFSEFYHRHPGPELLDRYYESFVKPMATFVANYIDTATGLPRPSYDLWEENFLTTTYTTSVAYAGLCAASSLAEIIGDADNAVTWKSAAEDIRVAARKHLFNTNRKSFYKGILANGKQIEYDQTIDVSSFFGAVMYDLFDMRSDEIKTAYDTLMHTFGATNESPMLPRYENDNYNLASDTALGNPWYVTSLWMAQYAIEAGNNDYAEAVLKWIEERLDETGMLSEQLDPETFEAVSVSPLVWSHAEYMTTLLDMMEPSV